VYENRVGAGGSREGISEWPCSRRSLSSSRSRRGVGWRSSSLSGPSASSAQQRRHDAAAAADALKQVVPLRSRAGPDDASLAEARALQERGSQ
jgi:hypothetical protein